MYQPELIAFIEFLRSEKQLSIHTQTNYQRDLQKFADYCQKFSLNNLADIRSQHIRQMVAQLHRQGLGGKSLSRWLSAMRSFFEFAIRNGYRLESSTVHPTHRLTLKKNLHPTQHS